MKLELEIVNPITYPAWDELLLTAQDYSFFCSSSWARVLHESYDYKPLYFILVDEGNLLVFLPFMEIRSFMSGNRGVSLPFSDYCAPILPENVHFQDILDLIIKYGEQAGWKYIEIRGGEDFIKNLPPSLYCYGHMLDISRNEEQIFADFKSSTKRNIKKAIREGVKAEIDNSFESIVEFYRLNCITRKMHGLPPQPFHFFRKIFEHVISKKRGVVVLATYKEKIISGAIFFHFGNKAIYKYGASDRSCQHLRANNLVMWEAIKCCSRNRITSFCFGRTEPENNGLRRFKSGWGSEERVINYYRYDLREKKTVIEKRKDVGFHNRVFRMMPVQLSRLVGKVLYRHVG